MAKRSLSSTVDAKCRRRMGFKSGKRIRCSKQSFGTIELVDSWHPIPHGRDHVKFHDCTNRWGRIGWLRNVILRGLSSGLKRQIGFIVNKTMFHLQKDKSSSYETHGLDFARLTLAMWPFSVALSTWRKNNPNKPWEKSLEEILRQNNSQLNKMVTNSIERLKILTSGHENCPVPEDEQQLLVWWSMPPPDHSSS